MDGFEAGRCTTCYGVWFNPSKTTSTYRIPRPGDYTEEKLGGPLQGFSVVGEIAEAALFLFLWE